MELSQQLQEYLKEDEIYRVDQVDWLWNYCYSAGKSGLQGLAGLRGAIVRF